MYLDPLRGGTSPQGAFKGHGNTAKMPYYFPVASTETIMAPKPAAQEAGDSVFGQFRVNLGTGSCPSRNFSARATRLAATRAKPCSVWPGPHGTGFGGNTVDTKIVRKSPPARFASKPSQKTLTLSLPEAMLGLSRSPRLPNSKKNHLKWLPRWFLAAACALYLPRPREYNTILLGRKHRFAASP